MDLVSTFKTEVFRPVVSILIPGATAISTYIYLLFLSFPNEVSGLANHATFSTVVFIIVTISCGMVLEDLGALIESFYGWVLARKNLDYDAEWNQYLLCHFDPKPIGISYYSSILVRVKFELSFSIAIMFSLIGIMIINQTCKDVAIFNDIYWKLIFIGAVVASYLLFEAYRGVVLLGDLRHQFLTNPVNIVTDDLTKQNSRKMLNEA